MGNNSPGLALSSPRGFWLRMGNGDDRSPKYTHTDYGNSFDIGSGVREFYLARAHRISVIIVAILIIGISLAICIGT